MQLCHHHLHILSSHLFHTIFDACLYSMMMHIYKYDSSRYSWSKLIVPYTFYISSLLHYHPNPMLLHSTNAHLINYSYVWVFDERQKNIENSKNRSILTVTYCSYNHIVNLDSVFISKMCRFTWTLLHKKGGNVSCLFTQLIQISDIPMYNVYTKMRYSNS